VASRLTDPPPTLDERLPAARESVPAARLAVRNFAGGLEVDLHGIELAVSEAVSNAVVHAYGDGGPGAIELSATASPYELTVVVRDHGTGIAAGGGTPGSGFGLAIIRRLAQHVELDDTAEGVAVTMRFRRGGPWALR
jgi:anti-sigma regulatory factor (Ser/Thr protein kinase)